MNLANNIELVLTRSISADDTEIIVNTTDGLPETPFPLTMNREEEIMYVTEVDGNTLTVERGQEDTEAKDYPADTEIWMNFTSGVYRELVHEDEIIVRVKDEEFQYYDGDEWTTLKGGSNLALGNVSNLSAEDKAGRIIELSWEDPEDLEADGITLAKWAGTQVRGKEGTYPSDEKDGFLVVDSTERDGYADEPYKDEDLDDGKTYYYMLFPYTEDGVFTIDSANRVKATAVDKYEQDPPKEPSVSDIAQLKATVESEDGALVSLDNEEWHDSPHTFEELTNEKEYTSYTKFPETDTLKESDVVEGETFTAIDKLPQDPPSAPEVSDIDHDKATVEGGDVVSIDNEEWFDSPHTFKGLEAETEYTAYAKYEETDTHLESEVSSSNFETPSEAPGPGDIIAGDEDAGFFGEVPSDEFISGDDLASEVGITQGTSHNSDTPWLKYMYDGKIRFRPRESIRYGISWNKIDEAGCVDGSTTITFEGMEFRVMLMEGATEDPASTSGDRDAKGSEWNKIILPLSEKAIDGDWEYKSYVEDDVPSWEHDFGSGKKGMYTDKDLGFVSGNGNRHWCKERTSSSYRVYRGNGSGPSYADDINSGNTGSYRGWAPVLEVVE